MKYIILVMDGAADFPIKELGNKTPLQAADMPNITNLVKKSVCGKLMTIPDSCPADSAVANLSIMGYDPERYFNGRGVLEAASMGVELEDDDVALRCNLICIKDGKIKNHSAGHISNEEAAELIKELNKNLGSDEIVFHNGVSYRHLLVLKKRFTADIICSPPHDHIGENAKDLMVYTMCAKVEETVFLLNTLIEKSQELLPKHPVNILREKSGKDMANSIWPWAPGKKPMMKTLKERFGISGAVISAVDLIKGIGVYAGMEVINVTGATGLHDTNYEGKADAAIEALKKHDFVYLHVEAPDEASHERNMQLKIKTLEDFDKRLVGRILENMGSVGEEVALAILPDHPTPISDGLHNRNPVPFMMYKPGTEGDKVESFDEDSCTKGSLGLLKGEEFIAEFLK